MIQYSPGPYIFNTVNADSVPTLSSLMQWLSVQFFATGWTILSSPFGSPNFIAVTQPTSSANGGTEGLSHGVHILQGVSSIEFRVPRYLTSNVTGSDWFSTSVGHLLPNRSYHFIASSYQFFIVPAEYRPYQDGVTGIQDTAVMGGVPFFPAFAENPNGGSPENSLFWFAASRRNLTDSVRYPTFHTHFALGSLSRSGTPVNGGPVVALANGRFVVDFHGGTTHDYSAAPALMIPEALDGLLSWAPVSRSAIHSEVLVEPNLVGPIAPTPTTPASFSKENMVYWGQLWDSFLLTGKYPFGFRVRADGRNFMAIQQNTDKLNWTLFVQVP